MEDINIDPENSVQDTPEDGQKNEQVSARISIIEKAKKYWKLPMKRMRDDMKFARGIQWPGQKDIPDEKERYVVNIVLRHLLQRQAALYAKNPTAVAKRRETIDFTIWDGDLAKVQQAQQTLMQIQEMQMAAPDAPLPPEMVQMAQQAQALLEDYTVGMEYRKKVTAMGKTLEIVWNHQIGEQQPPFKRSMKHLVLRTLTTGISYVKLGYHRFNVMRPEDVDRVTDLTEQVAALEAAQMDMSIDDSKYEANSAELADANDLLAKLSGDKEAYMREGLDFDYPRSTSIIVDPECYDLDGFLGAGWIAQEFMLTPKQILEIYKIDVSDSYTSYNDKGEEISKETWDSLPVDKRNDNRGLVWEVWDKRKAQTYTICAGHPQYLVAPKTPDVHLERFWPFFVLIFNSIEDEENVYPPSDVELIRPMQVERNLMRQRIREHRDASRPGYVAPKGRLDADDKNKLQTREAHDVVELNGLAETDDIRRILQAMPTNPIDPNQYEVSTIDDDMYKAVGTQEAVMGGVSGASATETSIGESARLTSIGSAIDDLDDFLTQLTQSASQVLMMNMSQELATEIAGRGAVWPEATAQDISRDLWLEVKAGSSGRPNKAAEIQNMERLMPFILQIPGIVPKKLGEELIARLDDKLQIEDMYDENLPSIIAQNAQAQVSTGDPATDPNQQGSEGGDKTSVEQGDTNLGPRAPEQPRVMDPNRP